MCLPKEAKNFLRWELRTIWKRQCCYKQWCVFSSNAVRGLDTDKLQEVGKTKTKNKKQLKYLKGNTDF